LRGEEKTHEQKLKRAIDLFNQILGQKPYELMMASDFAVGVIPKFVEHLGSTKLKYNYSDMLLSAWKNDSCEKYTEIESMVFLRGGTYTKVRKRLNCCY
jgi:hypothetical protein